MQNLKKNLKIQKIKKMKISDPDQIISAVAHANFFCIPDLPEPISLGMNSFELVLSCMMMSSQE